MNEREKLEKQLYERMRAENDTFLNGLRREPADKIIACSYEVVCRNIFLYVLSPESEEHNLTSNQLKALLKYEDPLNQLFNDWMERDIDDMDCLRKSMEDCANDILLNCAKEKYSDPMQPMYGRSKRESFACGEYQEWLADHTRTLECSRVFSNEATNAYYENIFPEFLHDWEGTFGRERCVFVLACTMKQLNDIRNFSPTSQQVIARSITKLQIAGILTHDYATGNEPCVVNRALEYFAESS